MPLTFIPFQLDYDLVDYVGQLREGILEAYTGIVTGLKKTSQGKIYLILISCYVVTDDFSVGLLLPHSQSILDLIHRCLIDEERVDSLMRLSFGLLGDLADSFPNGEIKQLLLANWVANELRSKHRMPAETRKTMRWARDVRPLFLF